MGNHPRRNEQRPRTELGIKVIPPGVFAFGPKIAPALSTSNLFAVAMFALLAYSLYHFARKKLD